MGRSGAQVGRMKNILINEFSHAVWWCEEGREQVAQLHCSPTMIWSTFRSLSFKMINDNSTRIRFWRLLVATVLFAREIINCQWNWHYRVDRVDRSRRLMTNCCHATQCTSDEWITTSSNQSVKCVKCSNLLCVKSPTRPTLLPASCCLINFSNKFTTIIAHLNLDARNRPNDLNERVLNDF